MSDFFGQRGGSADPSISSVGRDIKSDITRTRCISRSCARSGPPVAVGAGARICCSRGNRSCTAVGIRAIPLIIGLAIIHAAPWRVSCPSSPEEGLNVFLESSVTQFGDVSEMTEFTKTVSGEIDDKSPTCNVENAGIPRDRDEAVFGLDHRVLNVAVVGDHEIADRARDYALL
jgi:hypothetical protein